MNANEIEALKKAIEAIGNLIGCFPKGSEQAKALEGQRGAILDVVLDLKVSSKSDETAKELYQFVGQNANSRLQNAIDRLGTDDALAGLLQKGALLDEVTKHLKR